MSFGAIIQEQVPISIPYVELMVLTLTPAPRLTKWFGISSARAFLLTEGGTILYNPYESRLSPGVE